MKSENNRDDIIHSGLITIIWYPNIHSRGFNHFGLVSNMEPRCDPAIGHRPYLYWTYREGPKRFSKYDSTTNGTSAGQIWLMLHWLWFNPQTKLKNPWRYNSISLRDTTEDSVIVSCYLSENISTYLLKTIGIKFFTQTRYPSGIGSNPASYQNRDNYNPDQGEIFMILTTVGA